MALSVENLTAFLFTDARGRIVFADDLLTQMLGYSHPSYVMGQPLHVLVYPMEQAADLIREVGSVGHVNDWNLYLLDAHEQKIDVRLSAIAAHNQNGEFIGADIKIRGAEKSDGDQQAPANHDDAMVSYIQQLGKEPTAAGEESERAASLLLYFQAQIQALYVLLSRMGGPRIVTSLEAVLVKTISKGAWPMAVLGGHVTADEGEVPDDAYLELLRAVIRFGINIVGRAALVREMQAVDDNIANHAQEAAEEAGLRQFLD